MKSQPIQKDSGQVLGRFVIAIVGSLPNHSVMRVEKKQRIE
jgi:hypothetical protein